MRLCKSLFSYLMTIIQLRYKIGLSKSNLYTLKFTSFVYTLMHFDNKYDYVTITTIKKNTITTKNTLIPVTVNALPLPLPVKNVIAVFCHYSFISSGSSCKWNHTVGSLLCLVLLT